MKIQSCQCNLCGGHLITTHGELVDGVALRAAGPCGAEYTIIRADRHPDGNVHVCAWCLKGLRTMLATLPQESSNGVD